MFEFVALLKNQQHPTYGLGKVRTTGGSDNTTRRTEENHRTGEMGGEWVRAAGWGGVVYSVALCSCGSFCNRLQQGALTRELTEGADGFSARAPSYGIYSSDPWNSKQTTPCRRRERPHAPPP